MGDWSCRRGHGWGTWYSYSPSISADGRYVAFNADYEEPLSGVPPDIYVFDRSTSTTEQVTHEAYCYRPSISADGRYVAFRNSTYWVVVYDRQAGTFQSVHDLGIQSIAISADGRYVAYSTHDYNPGGGHSVEDFIYVHDFQIGATDLICGGFDFYSSWPSISGGTGTSRSQRIARPRGGHEHRPDVFVRNRRARFDSLCDQDRHGHLTAPAELPRAGPGMRQLRRHGRATLGDRRCLRFSSDSLVFTTSGRRPSGTASCCRAIPRSRMGPCSGRGCAARAVNSAALSDGFGGGSITAPDFGAGVRCVRALGGSESIQTGQRRWYLVFYRDPNVLGGCPVSSTFNATQTGMVTWA
jgi:hypothetical protein